MSRRLFGHQPQDDREERQLCELARSRYTPAVGILRAQTIVH